MEYYNNIKREKEEIGEEVKKAENLIFPNNIY